jgi:outer membrane lipoprotein-sorting protein
MKWLACLASVILFVVGAAFQDSLPSLLQLHLKTLREAQSLTATINVTPIGEAAVEYRLAYAKPNMLKLSGPAGFTLIDGKTIYTYNAKDKTYSEAPASDEALQTVLRKDLYAWSAFFAKADKDFVKAAKAGATRNMKGNVVTEVAVTAPQDGFGQVTLYVDEKLGLARGFNLKTPEKEYLSIATELKVSTDPLPASEFVFTAPAGATKVDPNAKPQSNFADVQALVNKNCMPCHSSGQRAAGIALNNHQGIVATVTPGQPAQSRLVKSLRGHGASLMPKNRAPLPEAQIKIFEQWIADGAKP